MGKKILSVIFSLIFVCSLCFNGKAFANNKTPDFSNPDALEYEYNLSPFMQKERQVLSDELVDPSKALMLSSVYFGLGQIYAGDVQRGAWIMAGGTTLLVVALAFMVPRYANRQESVKSATTVLSYGSIALAYLLNIRDAYYVAEEKNKKINEELLFSQKSLENFSKIHIANSNDTVSISYRVLDF